MLLLRTVPIFSCITGISTILITRLISYLTAPQLFEHTIPTISKTAAFEPAYSVFVVGMTICAIMSPIFWTLEFLSHKRYFPLLTSRRNMIISILTCSWLAGIISGICLGILSNITLEDSDPTHIALSYGFFIFQLFAFLFDALGVGMMKKQLNVTNSHPLNMDLNYRRLIAYILPIIGVIYYFLYVAKDTDWFENKMLVQALYVSAEYIICISCFLYAGVSQRYIYAHYPAQKVDNAIE